MTDETVPPSPLSAAVFAILLSLAEGEKTRNPPSGRGRWGGKHGYMIMKDARSAGGGNIAMGPGTLYGSLDRMMRDELVEESGASDDERRRYYRLTSHGHTVLAGELKRLEGALRSARSLGLVPHGGGA
jgi:DNA-binding MarR family transcriptional regulator